MWELLQDCWEGSPGDNLIKIVERTYKAVTPISKM